MGCSEIGGGEVLTEAFGLAIILEPMGFCLTWSLITGCDRGK